MSRSLEVDRKLRGGISVILQTFRIVLETGNNLLLETDDPIRKEGF